MSIVKTAMILRCNGALCSQMVTLSIAAPAGGCLKKILREREGGPTEEDCQGWLLSELRDLCPECWKKAV